MAVKGKFAIDTSVTPEQSLNEIREVLKRYNATRFGMIEEETRIGIAFEMKRRRVRFTMPVPQVSDFKKKANGDLMPAAQMKLAYNKAVRQRWRGLLLTIKAKLESVEIGIETFDEAFMAQLVLADGRTMSEWAAPQIERIYDSGQMPPLLLGSGS